MPLRRKLFGIVTNVLVTVTGLAVVARLGYGFVADLAAGSVVLSPTTQLSNSSESVEERAANRIKAFGPKVAVRILFDAPHGGRPSNQQVACRHLTNLEVDPAALITRLDIALGDPIPEVQIIAARMFASSGSELVAKADANESLGEIALAAIGGELITTNETIRSFAALILVGFGPHASALSGSLTAFLDIPSPDFRDNAALALLKVEDQDNVPAFDTIVRLLADPEFIFQFYDDMLSALRKCSSNRVDELPSALAARLKDQPRSLGAIFYVLTRLTPEAQGVVPAIEAVFDVKAHVGRGLDDYPSSVIGPLDKIDHDLNGLICIRRRAPPDRHEKLQTDCDASRINLPADRRSREMLELRGRGPAGRSGRIESPDFP